MVGYTLGGGPGRFVSNVLARVLISDADANSFECLSSRAHFCRFVLNVSARVLIPAADVVSFECLSSRAHFC